jgi:hypothetical protein
MQIDERSKRNSIWVYKGVGLIIIYGRVSVENSEEEYEEYW